MPAHYTPTRSDKFCLLSEKLENFRCEEKRVCKEECNMSFQQEPPATPQEAERIRQKKFYAVATGTILAHRAGAA